jgi:hypothetical protein
MEEIVKYLKGKRDNEKSIGSFGTCWLNDIDALRLLFEFRQ